MNDASENASIGHPFEKRPHRTFIAYVIPVFGSLIAEPLTGLVDTAFVARIGANELGALGAATIVLSSLLWAFNFLGIGTHTQVANAMGANDFVAARKATAAALLWSLILGGFLGIVGWLTTGAAAQAMGAEGDLALGFETYLGVRWFGAPAVLITMVGMGALRGLQDMKTPLFIAITTNGINLVLDPVLIFGLGPIPAMGLKGAAIATVLAQCVGALVILRIVARRLQLDFETRVTLKAMRSIIQVGGDLFVRTGLLMLFLLLATRLATMSGEVTASAHQVIRQVWFFTALVLDAYAAAAQSLVGYFLGASKMREAGHVARISCGWGFGTGIVLAFLLMWSEAAFAILFVPDIARSAFSTAWWISVVTLPLNAISFVTDGVHWATADYRFLRNAMILSSGISCLLLQTISPGEGGTLREIWIVTGVFVSIRAGFGYLRIWPGIGSSPWKVDR